MLAYNKTEKRNIWKIRSSQLARKGTQRLCHLFSCCTYKWWPFIKSCIEKFQNGTLKLSIKAMKADPQTFVFRVFWEGRVVTAGRDIGKCKFGLLSVKRTPRTLPKQKRLLGPMQEGHCEKWSRFSEETNMKAIPPWKHILKFCDLQARVCHRLGRARRNNWLSFWLLPQVWLLCDSCPKPLNHRLSAFSKVLCILRQEWKTPHTLSLSSWRGGTFKCFEWHVGHTAYFPKQEVTSWFLLWKNDGDIKKAKNEVENRRPELRFSFLFLHTLGNVKNSLLQKKKNPHFLILSLMLRRSWFRDLIEWFMKISPLKLF